MKKKMIQIIIVTAFAFLLSCIIHSNTEDKIETDIQVIDGYAVKVSETLDTKSVERAIMRFRDINTTYLSGTDSKIYYSIVADKAYFIKDNPKCTFDYVSLTEMMEEEMDFAEYIDILPLLSLDDYYKTDVHWRQEKLLDVASLLAQTMGTTVETEYTSVSIPNPFYGSYMQEADLAVDADTLYYMENDTLKNCKVYDYEEDSYISVYQPNLAEGKKAYDLFLSGSKSLLTIENPNATTKRELIVFRDSFASSLAPLLASGYAKITLVDIRYISSAQLKNFITFEHQDVLFLYSTPVLNNSITLRG